SQIKSKFPVFFLSAVTNSAAPRSISEMGIFQQRHGCKPCPKPGPGRESLPYTLDFMHGAAKFTLLGLQGFVVLFVGLHNWIPLGKLNDVSGVRKEFPGSKLLITTLINFTPYAFGLAASAVYFERTFPGWL